jgi:starch phosphorylase
VPVKPIRSFTVVPSLPPELGRLRDLAYNLRWSWNHETIGLFRRLDRDLWETSGHNPVRMLGSIDQGKLLAAATDDGFRTHMGRVVAEFDAYMEGQGTWFERKHGADRVIAYFSAEFGLTECVSIFAGGLGVLAGDHLKSSSDLGLPLVGVGLLYQQGYFRQYLNEAGWQQQAYEDNDFYNLPLTLVRSDAGTPLQVTIPELGKPAVAHIWRAQVGRVPLFLLDTNVAENEPAERDITDQLYGGDAEMRIRQEIVLGIGGVRALEAMGIDPGVYHMNEGHSAFLGLERMRRLMQKHRLTFAAAREVASAGLVFTTHTPIAAGHDYFAPELVERYLAGCAAELGLSTTDFLALGRQHGDAAAEPFCMTVLALRLAAYSNGVSRLHGKVSRQMWSGLWPGVPEDEIPIRHITNGVHFRSWISEEMNQLYDRYLGVRWREEPTDRMVWHTAARIPGEELWRTHERRRERLVTFVRRRLRAQLERRGAPHSEIEAADSVLDAEALTIGFARRFATYKRGTLLLRDPDRLARILNDPQRPVQIVFAGKAHPRDDAGKALIQRIVDLARQPKFRRRIVFVEDYDMSVTRSLVQGADVWLNTPLRPNEASGTSGMKAVANAVLNLSTLDGWWDEAWGNIDRAAAPFGWAIGRGETYDDPEVQDAVEAAALYELLEDDVVPCFYTRGADGEPAAWTDRMRASLGTLAHVFNTHRMVREYTERFYLPARRRSDALGARELEPARQLAVWRSRVEEQWPRIRVEVIDSILPAELRIDDEVVARARVHLGKLHPEDVRVELYLGRVDAEDEIIGAEPALMKPIAVEPSGAHIFESKAAHCRGSGRFGYTVRVLPQHAGLPSPFVPGLVTWATNGSPAG